MVILSVTATGQLSQGGRSHLHDNTMEGRYLAHFREKNQLPSQEWWHLSSQYSGS